MHIADLSLPLSEASLLEAEAWREAGLVISTRPEPVEDVGIHGYVVLTQTCDIVRDCIDRPRVVVAPLARVGTDAIIRDIKLWRRPRYGWVAATEAERLVADLDCAMTVEKAVVARWKRTPGWNLPVEFKVFVTALERNVRRAAFPDEFLSATKKMREHFRKRHGKKSEEGEYLERLQEVRVCARTSWDDLNAQLDWWFIVDEITEDDETAWSRYVSKWGGMLDGNSRFKCDDPTICDKLEISAFHYWESDMLDFDSLSHENITESETRDE